MTFGRHRAEKGAGQVTLRIYAREDRLELDTRADGTGESLSLTHPDLADRDPARGPARQSACVGTREIQNRGDRLGVATDIRGLRGSEERAVLLSRQSERFAVPVIYRSPSRWQFDCLGCLGPRLSLPAATLNDLELRGATHEGRRQNGEQGGDQLSSPGMRLFRDLTTFARCHAAASGSDVRKVEDLVIRGGPHAEAGRCYQNSLPRRK